jgi:hypothetical protein
MPRAIVLVIVLTVAASRASAGSAPLVSPRTPVASATSGVQTCPFRVGDTVRRAGGGAAVPPPGQAVVGNFDGVERSGMIQIETGGDGLVTITSRVSGHPERVETCRLADA